MPAQKSLFFCGCLARRPRMPRTVLETHERRDTRPFQEVKPGPCMKPADASDATNLTVNDVPHSTVLLKETIPLSAAFERACLDRPEDQKVALRKAQGLHELFEQLEKSNQKSSEESTFRRGVKRLTPTIGVIGGSMGFVGSLTALDPVANNAFGIVQSVMTIAIGVCGAEIQFQEHVEAILQGITVIQRYDEIWDSTRSRGPHVFKTLVNIYTDLLDFYFEAMLILQSDSFFLGVQKSRFRQRLPEIASSFKGHTEQLDKFLIQEILALNQKIDDDQMSIKIRSLLDNGNQDKQIEYYESLRERADEACAWVVSSIGFREWLGHSNYDLPIPAIPASKFCILFGDMGSGKSATTSFVVDFLTSHPISSDSMKPLVCVYYCKNDNETNKARNIYRSILLQVLRCMGQLKPTFLKWYKEAQTRNSQSDPTRNNDALRDFLVDVLQTFSRRLYLVLDGVDECDRKSRDHILEFFQRFHKHGAPVSVFLSCRYDESLKERLPPERRILQMQSSRERDRIIAAYLVERLLTHQPKELQDMIVQELASQANGSAIWLKMVLEYLMRVSPSKGQITRELKHIPPPQNLSKLYRKLFETATAELPENGRVLECALETLAVSRRLLTMDELTYAVTLQVEEQKIRTLGDAEDYLIDSVRLQRLIGPFVSFSDHAGSGTVRLVHQSLRDLIHEKPASAWGSDGRSEDKNQRLGSLHSKLLSCCVKYLLLDFEGKELFPKEQLDALERREDELEFFGDFNMESDEDQPRKSGSSRAPSREFDPDTAGFGKFFVYAACYWTEHFKDCAPNALPEGDDIAKLARRGSPTLRNWAETYKRPNLTLSSQRDLDVEDFDELIVATTFGSEAFLSTFLERKFEKDRIRDKSPREAVKRLMRSGNLNAVKIMLQNESLQYTFRDGLFLYQIIDMCQDATHTESANPQKWNELLSILVCDFFSSGDAPFHWANTFLCSAARQGCLPMIKILFTKASKEPDLAKALVAETHTDSPYQSVGEAAFWGHADIVQYLLTQKHVDITSHLYHRTTRDRRNVLHWAALSKKDATILRILAERLPSGVEEQSTEGDTPLQLLTFGHHASIEAVLALVDVGKADVNSSPGGTYCSPLRNAIRAKNVEACRLLVSYGAHVDDALQRDEASRKIVLADNLEDAEASQRILDILVPPR